MRKTVPTFCACASLALIAFAGNAAGADRRPGALAPSAGPRGGVSSDAHRGGPGGYGVYKSRRARQEYRNDLRSGSSKRPYEYRYYSDTDRSPGSCRRYADRAIETRNRNWWMRYRACRGGE
jgi:hypothetical protein